MNKYSILLTIAGIFSSGCAVPIYDIDNPDQFVLAAVSWEGGDIKNMISAWGYPNQSFSEPSQFANGYAAWTIDESTEIQEAHEKRLAKRQAIAEQTATTTCYGKADQWGNVATSNCRTTQIPVYDNSITHAIEMERASVCSVVAEFDEDGKVISVTATSKNCSTSEPNQFRSLTRLAE